MLAVRPLGPQYSLLFSWHELGSGPIYIFLTINECWHSYLYSRCSYTAEEKEPLEAAMNGVAKLGCFHWIMERVAENMWPCLSRGSLQISKHNRDRKQKKLKLKIKICIVNVCKLISVATIECQFQ